ncbi:MAG: MBL fold metallo-hydrolase [Spirochaetales bacterium]|nr:MBL fold metallo-hydrolase [Spirochaetales bacterium]
MIVEHVYECHYNEKPMMETVVLRYGNTNTYLINGSAGSILVDTDMPGTIGAFFKEIKRHGIRIKDISFVMATHYHPDHMGLISELMDMGVRLLLVDIQNSHIHDWEAKIGSKPIDGKSARIISIDESRSFLGELGIHGEMIHIPSHSEDSVGIMLDDGTLIAGDLSPISYLQSEPEVSQLRDDWNLILDHHPKLVLFAHSNQLVF